MRGEYYIQDVPSSPDFLTYYDGNGSTERLVMAEVEELMRDCYDSGAEHPTIVTAEGYDGEMNYETGVLEVYTDDFDPNDEAQCELGERVGANKRAFSFELVPGDNIEEGEPSLFLQSSRCHTTLGKLGIDGAFIPIVTMIDESHPARARAGALAWL